MDARPVRADASAEARVHFEQGNRSLEQAMRSRGPRKLRLLEQALSAYVASLRIVQSRNVLFNAGLVTHELGWVDDAFGYFRDYLAMADLTAEERAAGEERLEGLRSRVALVAIETDPAGVELRVDRRDLPVRGSTPLELALPRGEHTLFLARPGYAERELQVVATVGARAEVVTSLVPLPVLVRVAGSEGGRLLLDGTEQGSTTELTVAPGRHTLRAETATGEVAERVLEVPIGSPRLEVALVPALPTGTLAIEADMAVEFELDGDLIGLGRRRQLAVAAGTHSLRAGAPGHAPLTRSIEVRSGEVTTVALNMAPLNAPSRSMGAWPYVTGGVGLLGALAAAFLSLDALEARDQYDASVGVQSMTEQWTRRQALIKANTAADVGWGLSTALLATTVVLWALDEEIPPQSSEARVQTAAATPEAAAPVSTGSAREGRPQ